MANQQHILDAIDQAAQRLATISERIREQPDLPTRDGDWSVRELLCHVAATANYTELFRRIDAHDHAFPTLAEMDEDNERQRAERAGRSIDELLDEARQGFAAARISVRRLSDEQLAEPGPASDEDTQTVGDVIMVYLGHAGGHIATLEHAVDAAS